MMGHGRDELPTSPSLRRDGGPLIRVVSTDTSRILAAKVYACSTPTSPWQAQGNRLSGSGTTQINLAFSLPINASATSTEGGSPGIGVSWPVRALNQTRPRIPVNLLISVSPLGQPVPGPDRSASHHPSLKLLRTRARQRSTGPT